MFHIVELLLVFQVLRFSDGRLDCDGRSGAGGPGTTSHCFPAGTTVADPHSLPLHLVLPQKGQVYLVCRLISIFFIIFLREGP